MRCNAVQCSMVQHSAVQWILTQQSTTKARQRLTTHRVGKDHQLGIFRKWCNLFSRQALLWQVRRVGFAALLLCYSATLLLFPSRLRMGNATVFGGLW